MYVVTEVDPLAAIRTEARRALRRPLAIRLWYKLTDRWREARHG